MIEILDRLDARFAELERLMADPTIASDQRKMRDVAREHKALEPSIVAGKRYRSMMKRIEEARSILRESKDKEMVELAQGELEELEPQVEGIEEELKFLLVPKDPNDSRDIVVEIRAGTGGEEAALFAADLYRMYQRYADAKGWRSDVLTSNPTGVGGFKEIIFSVEGEDAYGKLKFESGVHRVQRVPATEASGRIHTSAASVAVLPEAEEVDVQLEEKDLKIDVFRSSGPGGQSVNTTDSAVRITHLPTGLVVSCQDEKSQLKNKTKALKVLRARLLDIAQREQREKQARERRGMVSTGDRSAKIRTYNFPQSRVTDHRIGLTLHRLDGILGGDLDELIEALRAHDRQELLAAQGTGAAA
jgi:peptide chain release factor 1